MHNNKKGRMSCVPNVRDTRMLDILFIKLREYDYVCGSGEIEFTNELTQVGKLASQRKYSD